MISSIYRRFKASKLKFRRERCRWICRLHFVQMDKPDLRGMTWWRTKYTLSSDHRRTRENPPSSCTYRAREIMCLVGRVMNAVILQKSGLCIHRSTRIIICQEFVLYHQISNSVVKWSVSDINYHTRAWPSIEMLIIQTFKKSYNLQMYCLLDNYRPYSLDNMFQQRLWLLRDDRLMDLEIVMKDKEMSFEEDTTDKDMLLER